MLTQYMRFDGGACVGAHAVESVSTNTNTNTKTNPDLDSDPDPDPDPNTNPGEIFHCAGGLIMVEHALAHIHTTLESVNTN